MNRDEISAATHGDLAFHNPLDPDQLDEVIARIPLARGARVLDVGCGPGELLLRLHERHAIRGVGIDSSAMQIAEAERRRPAGAGLEFIQGDADDYEPTHPGFDMVACLGSIHALGGGIRQLASFVKPGGWVLLGDGHWRREPEPAYLQALGGATADELPDRTGLLLAGERHGLTTTYVAETTEAAWDRYEWALVHNAETDGRPEVLEWAARARHRYAGPGGRDTLGFALVLMRKRP